MNGMSIGRMSNVTPLSLKTRLLILEYLITDDPNWVRKHRDEVKEMESEMVRIRRI